jgi:carbonic anhydrase
MHTSLAIKTMKSKFSILTTAVAAIVLSLPLGTIAKEPEHADAAAKVSPADALARLKAGNQRFVAGKLQHPHQDSKRRAELAKGQRPFAIVLGCADSRTSPEVLFDQGLGDLFVIRVAGNVLDDHALASIEYGVEHLGARLIVVLGHQRCGAVQAAKETIDSNAEAPAHINSLVTAIQPAVEATRGADVEATVKANIDNVVEGLRSSEPVLKKEVETGAINVVGAYYNLDTAAVSFTEKKKE